ncbi:hypothetical protein QBC39DRAFT_366419 [Podospora conica]|nr:hypothetical protein QBC39DRAFT_366419 [Schizothecium conicum]
MQPIPSIETVMTSMAMTDAPSRGFTPRARSPTPAQMSRAESIVSLIDAASERLYLNRKINDPRARSWTREQDEVWEKKSQETALEMFAKSVKLEEMEIAGLTEQGVRPTPQALGRAVSRFRDIQGTPPPHRPEVNYFDDSQRFSATPGSRGSEKPGSRATPCPDQGSSKRDPTKFLSPNPNRGISETQPRPSPGPIEGTRGEKVEKPGNGKGLMLPPPKPVSAADIKLEAYVSLPKDNKRNGDMWNHDLFRGNRHGFLSSTVGFEGWGTGTEIGREFARYEEAWTEASRKPNALSREARLQRRNHPSGDQ